jgi:prophage regulatory protein
VKETNTPAASAAISGTPGHFLDVSDVANRYRVSTDTIWRWSRNGGFPKPCKLSAGSTRWRLTDLIDHEAQLSTGFAFSLTFLVLSRFGGAPLIA